MFPGRYCVHNAQQPNVDGVTFILYVVRSFHFLVEKHSWAL